MHPHHQALQDDDFVVEPKAKISAAPGGSVSKSGGGASGGKSGSGRDHNMDLCDRCEEGGVVVMCDGPCQRSFHPACLGMDDKPKKEPWMCNRCKTKVQRVSKFVLVEGGVEGCRDCSGGRLG